MNSHEVDEQMALISQYYPDHAGIITHFVQAEQGAAGSSKPRRRRRKNKGVEGGGDGAALRKRKLSDEQVNMLEKSFGSEHKLESERKEKLAAELGLDPRQVAVWFQNRRARWKSKKLEDEYNKLRAEHDTTVLEKCRLETQLLKLKEQLQEAETEIQRLSSDGFTSNSSPASSSVLSMDQTPFLGDNNIHFGLQNVFCANGLEWDNLYYM